MKDLTLFPKTFKVPEARAVLLVEGVVRMLSLLMLLLGYGDATIGGGSDGGLDAWVFILGQMGLIDTLFVV